MVLAGCSQLFFSRSNHAQVHNEDSTAPRRCALQVCMGTGSNVSSKGNICCSRFNLSRPCAWSLTRQALAVSCNVGVNALNPDMKGGYIAKNGKTVHDHKFGEHRVCFIEYGSYAINHRNKPFALPTPTWYFLDVSVQKGCNYCATETKIYNWDLGVYGKWKDTWTYLSCADALDACTTKAKKTQVNADGTKSDINFGGTAGTHV